MNIAIFCPNWIGDAVMATPAFAALRRHFRSDRLIGVFRPYVDGVLEGGGWFDETVLFHGGPWSQSIPAVSWKLRQLRVDTAVLFTNSFRSAYTAWLAGCRRIIGYARGGRSWMLTDCLPAIRDERGQFVPSPVIDAYNQLAVHLGCDDPGYRMTLHTQPQDESAADVVWDKFNLYQGTPVVGLNPGAAYGAAKHWPTKYFIELARRLADDGSSVLVMCGPAERPFAREIVASSGRDNVSSLADEALSPGLTKACIRRVDLLITTDSGPRHFATAFDRPVITLFGPTHIAWTETYHAKALHMQKKVECGPCQLRTCPLDHRCMKELTPAEVHLAAGRHLAQHYQPEEASRGIAG